MSVGAAGSQCAECGADQRFGTCHDLFLRLLALDYEQKHPYADWHALNVAGYFLQHPSRASARLIAGQYQMARTFTLEGMEGVRRAIARAVRGNNHRVRSPRIESPVASLTLLRLPAVTIETVSVDGRFPPAGYADRVGSWIRETVLCYGDPPSGG